ncbi:MAG: cyclic nucleotide-binding domain-containing protein [Acidiferrobacterales bacterium]
MTEIECVPGSELIQALQPIAALSILRIEELKPLCHIEHIPAGMILFREGETDYQTVYLLRGEIVLSSAKDEDSCMLGVADMAGNAPKTLCPIADKQPRQVSAMAVTDLDILRIDSELLDIAVTWDTLAGCLAAPGPNRFRTDSGSATSWMGMVRQCLVFRHIPPPNLDLLGMRLESVAVRAGQVVAREGEDADGYYLVENGTAVMTCETDGNGPADVTMLGPGTGFGEESLSGEDRWHASVTMETRGTLLRLARRHFLALRREPPLNWLSPSEAMSMTESGAIWLDVRALEEASDSLLPGAYRLPLDMLCQVADGLDPHNAYICYCNTGRRSSAAAHILGQRGLRAYVLAGGLRGTSAGFGRTAPC